MVVSLFIGLGPRRDVTERDLWEEIDRLVPVRGIRMRDTCAFVDVENIDDAHYVQRKLNNVFVRDSRLSVQLSKTARHEGGDRRDNVDRRRGDDRRGDDRRGDDRRDSYRRDDPRDIRGDDYDRRRGGDDRRDRRDDPRDRSPVRRDDKRESYRRGDRRDRSPDRYDERVEKHPRTERRRSPEYIPPPMTGGCSRSPSPSRSPPRAPSH